ncbi:lysozyme inhibitor LprI family protein [Aquibacillus saliphilus]|uniref:lysozyme inhibitor LprI family protein n=1 Tax=Aquibacillus saliphilus TaxID=1909422 RepID=UPI001CF0BCCC|nr:lysozyme inhibitor LprI family protein [Aquibacillus saliphilus]
MKNNKKIVTVMLSALLVILVACDNSTNELSAKSNNQSSNNSSTQNADDVPTNKDLIDTDQDTTENSSQGPDNTHLNEKENTSNDTSTDSKNGKSLEFSNSDNEITESEKEEYLKKLNKMEEADRTSEAGTTIAELEEQETGRYNKWDEELNKIYKVLKEQLNTKQMDKLRDEQRNWIKHRDEAAKESSLKYKGGSTESLEYIAMQASLTRERCYVLVAKYMK